MKVLVIGAGAREHALVLGISQDPTVSEIHAAPGNPGIGELARLHQVQAESPASVVDLAQSLGVDLVVVGPEAPLVAGVADALAEVGIACFGPSAAAAQLEASKAFAKEVMHSASVPTARSVTCTDLVTVAVALDELGSPYVVKYDGLAAGKGVVVTEDRDEALAHTQECLAKPDGRVVLEEYLDGPEVSLFCVTDGKTVLPLQAAQDFKRVGEGDTGPNTGGMGAYTPLPWAPDDLADWVVDHVAQPTVVEMARRGTPFAGLLYVGLALTSRGVRVVEFNARFGDPETQVVLAALQSPLAGLLHAAATGTLADFSALEWHDGALVTVVVASENYPATPVTGDPIYGIEDASELEHVAVLHAGTAVAGGSGTAGDGTTGAVVGAGAAPVTDGATATTESPGAADEEVGADSGLVSAGGRVLSVVGAGVDLAAARANTYAGVAKINLRGSHYRRDIAQLAQAGKIELSEIYRNGTV